LESTQIAKRVTIITTITNIILSDESICDDGDDDCADGDLRVQGLIREQ
jgi:hypothetical protein